MLNQDLFFTYKYTLRFILINKYGTLLNTYNIPKINKLLFFFSFKKLEDLDDIELYNCFYLFKFFFGRNAFFSKTKSSYFLGKWYYNMNVQLILNKNFDIHYILYYYLNNIIYNIDKTFFKKGFFGKNMNIFFFLVKDVNVFSELKTNLGLFNLQQPLNLNIYLTGCDNNKNLNKLFINLFKF